MGQWTGDNRAIQKEIDMFRKEVIMYERLSNNLGNELSKRDADFQRVFTESKIVN
jgi:hypothetical protein